MPINNNTLGFQLKRDLETITITKTGTRKIEFRFYYQEDCKVYKELNSSVEVVETLTIKIPNKDGKYKIRIISTNTTTEEFEYVEYSFTDFDYLLRSIINDVEVYITNCYDCTNCNDCNGEDESIESILMSKMLSFYILNREYYDSFFNNGLACIECSILDMVNCLTLTEITQGKATKSELNRQIISYLYFIFYLAEKSIFTCCLDSIDNKFKIYRLRKHLNKNINTNCIETAILTNPGYYMSDSNLIEL